MGQKDLTRDEVIHSFEIVGRFLGELLYDSPLRAIVAAAPQPQLDGPDVLTRAEAAKMLKVSPTTITRMRSENVLHPVKELLPIVRYRREDLQKFIDKRR